MYGDHPGGIPQQPERERALHVSWEEVGIVTRPVGFVLVTETAGRYTIIKQRPL